MTTFRCKRSGNTVSFTLPADIEGLRKHEGYVEILENEVQSDPAQIPSFLTVPVEPTRRGRGRAKLVK